MGVLTWLRDLGKPWLGSRSASPDAAVELERDKARVRTAASGGRYRFLPYVDSMTGETAVHRRAYRRMLAEPSIKAALLDKVLSVAALDLAVNPGDEGDQPERVQRNRLAASFGLHLLNNLTGGDFGLTGLPAFVETVILPGLIDGFSVSEKIWRPELRGRWAGKLLLTLKNKDTGDNGCLDLEVDNYNRIVSLMGKGPNSGQQFDTSGFVIWRHLGGLFDNPGGMSDLRAAYRAWMMIDTITKLRAIYLEKYSAGPMLVGKYTSTGTEKDQLEEGLEAARAQTWLSIPVAAQLEAINLATTNGEQAFKSGIDDYKEEVFIGITGAVLQSLEGRTADGRGNSEVHASTAGVRKWHIRACVESVLNSQVLPDATDLNFAGVDCPKASLGGVDDTELAASLTVDKGLLVDMKVPLSKKDLYQRYGRPQPLDEADTLQPPELPPGGIPFAEQPKPVPAPAQPPAKEVPVVEPFREAGQASSWGYAFRRED